ncbi:aldehyde dehydrogenase family protein [Campylobacter upsaliensis]|uniref:L-glutamate gamma-semialdehyde dehydrogenase n=1 Tax=Campylobacter upsaliensis TaxID=28080 RepID=A0A5M1DQ89_CAMUP|nr:proline dehydrogenase family protein [Campylobacter upsaliensis]EAI2900810.1 aldehyde dehydrogenase family protein [Campylobacter upsaliensis]EAI9943899.1 aldehyde dehydrogenase family protein [Campylobacter upsaliensis]EAK1466935.1 aldehyde dehydrogenase family protein [Campylobacter upsaliensis]ECV9716701.1 aldehyde dehydrogenase family protein [Campylobacter upsaliensis]ECV9718105.1 aldehyde dehydrogenase family protein [Campylobacter upsaliensis]
MIQKSIALAEELQSKIEQNLSASERQFHAKMQKLLNNPKNKVMLIELLDRSFRCKDKKASFELIEHTLNKFGIADFFSAFEKFLLFSFLNFGKLSPNLSVPFFISHLRNDTKAMVLDADENFLAPHITKRKNEQNITLNVNLIGEEVLGEAESKYRMQKYEEALKSSYITYISIKITTIFSQINIIDFDYSKDEVVKRLDKLYALALEEQNRQGVSKFINLDMEEFRDLELTVAAFMESVGKFDIKAGIVLQAYIPDSYEYLKKLLAFSKERVLKGMQPIKIRFVKGANMESEETIASQRGWELPTFERKIDTDSNYNKMLDLVLEDENYKYINVGIASHNIFEIAYAYTRIKEAGASESFTFEMLEGMSLQCSYELSKMHDLILYAPVCDEAHFNNAIAYLVRRLDENTSEDNFMRYFFNLKVGSKEWEEQKSLFLNALEGIKTLDNTTHRKQNRTKIQDTPSSYITKTFTNESDTDFILSQNRLWAQNIKAKYENLSDYDVYPVAGELDFTQADLNTLEVKDKIAHRTIGTAYLAGENELKAALKVAKNSNFTQKSSDEIYGILAKVAKLMRERRGDLIGLAALETGKTFLEIDPEVSEAIDFVEFYPHSLETLKKQNPNTTFKPKGIGVTIAPWNFPVGISVGTIAAPLAAGNVVLYKPSSLSMLTGYKLCECFWDAGIPRDALIFLPAKGSDISKYILSDEAVKFSILTGGEDTAYAMLEANPTLLLSAETGGKNATIVSKFADRDSAVKNIIHSAFSNSGQKCSATSLLVLEDEVYEDEEFKKALVDAAASLAVGSPFVFKNKLGALCDKPSEKLIKAINELEAGEEWALKPTFINDNAHLMTPGIKYGVKKGAFTHMNELFAPLLSVMRAKDLKEAIELVNATGYGLTAGFESLDEREWEYFHTHIEAGNIYINKPTTGAIVLRQPFGGVKKSAIGFGRKVGIYNYITQFMDIEAKADTNLLDSPLANALEKLSKASDESIQATLANATLMAKSYAYHYKHEFSVARDYVNIRGEDNLFSYTRIKNLAFRVCEQDSLQDILGVIIGCHTLGLSPLVSYDSTQSSIIKELKKICKAVDLGADFVEENEEQFIAKISKFERIRYHAKADKNSPLYQAAAKEAKIIIRDKPLLNGRFELLFYHNEKALSVSYHRYGNLGIRALKNSQ